MTNSSRPDGTDADNMPGSGQSGPAEHPSNGPDEDLGVNDDAQPKPQAYVDPSIAAEAQIATLEAEISDLKDKFVRAHAEMDNLRKRTEREKADTTKYAVSKFAADVLAVADNLQRALEAVGHTDGERDPQMKALLEGVELTETELKKALERHGVRPIIAAGTQFDPNFHQAVMEEENKDVAAGSVLRVFQEGYQIGDRVLRPSMVVVARGGFKHAKASVKDTTAAPAAANDDMPEASSTANGENQSSDNTGDDQSAS